MSLINSKNGSIRHLERRGKKNDGEYGKIDNLHAYYDGNQLQRVEDNISEDGNGNVNGNNNGMRSMYLFPGGYCNLNDPTVTGTDSISYHYYNKDHLGNNREVISENGQVEQIVHYYPFGTPFTDGSSTNIGLQPYLYGNKELDMMHGLNTYDFGARNYNPLLAMWDRVDPMCEKYYWMNPYVYCGNSPVLFVDPTGMIIDLSAMTDEERERYYKELDLLRSGSQLFDTLIETLENSSNTIYVRYGDTSDVSEKEVNGHSFFKDGLPTVEFSKNQNTMFSTYSEEFFHAYQNENIQNYSGEFNYEFEAKVFAICVGEEYGGYGNYNGFEDFKNNLSNHTYGNQKNPIKPDTVLKSSFIRDYMNAAESYRHYNVLNNVGNSNYKKRTTVSPYSLQTIVLKTFLDRF